MTPDFRRMALLAKHTAIVYKTDLNQLAFDVQALGLTFGGIVTAPGFQALVAREPDDSQIVAYRGTPVTCGRDIEDALTALGYDLCLHHTDLGNGALVLSCPHRAVAENWPAVAALVDFSKPVTITGHSLGAVEAMHAAEHVPAYVRLSVIVFAPFQSANNAYWQWVFAGRDLPWIVGREEDFALGWNHFDPVTHLPRSVLHLDDGSWSWRDDWPWYDESVPDHDVGQYVKDLDALADAQLTRVVEGLAVS